MIFLQLELQRHSVGQYEHISEDVVNKADPHLIAMYCLSYGEAEEVKLVA